MPSKKDKNTNFQKEFSFGSSFGSSDSKLPNSFDAVLGRLKSVFGVETDTDFARSMGFKQGSVSGAKLKQTIPPAWIMEVALTQGVSADWLLTGEGEMRRSTPPSKETHGEAEWDGQERRDNHDRRRSQLQTFVCGDREMVMVPLLETVLSSGTGSLETGGAALGSYGFRYDYLKRKGNPQTMRLFLSMGDSNYPEILDKDLVLIDTSQTQPMPGKKFAISVHGMTYIKQIDADAEGLLLISRNPDYPPMRVDMQGDESGDVYIIGRMICLCRDFD